MPTSLTDSAQNPREIFDRKRRRLVLERSARLSAQNAEADFIAEIMADEIIARLQWVKRDFKQALIVGKAPARLIQALHGQTISVHIASPASGLLCEEDRLPFADASFDLMIAIGTLDSVNDLPGALVLARKILRPDGLLLAAFLGAPSLSTLKSAMIAADLACDRPVAAHIHPQIDARAAGDLMQRAGLAMPVADSETLTVRYAGLPALVRDLRAMGASNMLSGPVPFVGKAGLIAAAQYFAEKAEADGKTSELFELVYLSGWSPSPDQPKPARRGSATASLKDALKKSG